MPPIGTLWAISDRPQTKIICSVAALNDLELELHEWSFSDRPAVYTAKFPYGKVPAFEGSDGFKLIESATITRYLCGLGTKVNLLGSDAKEIAQVDQWTHFAEQEIGGPCYNIVALLAGIAGPFNRENLDKQTERLVRALNYVETYLANCPSGYLVSDTVTAADFFLAGGTYGCCSVALGAAEREKYPSVLAHYTKVTGNEKVKQFWGTDRFTEVAMTESFKH